MALYTGACNTLPVFKLTLPVVYKTVIIKPDLRQNDSISFESESKLCTRLVYVPLLLIIMERVKQEEQQYCDR